MLVVMPPPPKSGALSVDGRIFVCLSVCPVPDLKSRMEGRSKLKIGRKKARDTDDLWPHLEIERSEAKVIKSEVKTAS